MNQLDEEIKNCEYCNDPEYFKIYLHYFYIDDKEPKVTCERHPDYRRKWGCITNPQWIINLKHELDKE